MSQVGCSRTIGVLGTLMGVVLGWLLNRIQRLGRIRIFPVSINVQYYKVNQNKEGKTGDPASEIISQSFYDNEVRFVTMDIVADVYNSSSTEPQMGRDFYMGFHGGGKEAKARVRKKKFIHEGMGEELKNINLLPREIVNVILSCSINENMSEFDLGYLFFEYRNNKNKVKRIKINGAIIPEYYNKQ